MGLSLERSMASHPRELHPRNISLYESLGIAFFEALFLRYNLLNIILVVSFSQSLWFTKNNLNIMSVVKLFIILLTNEIMNF